MSVMRVWESYLINNAAICQDSGNNFQSLPLDTSRFLLQNPYCISSTSVSTQPKPVSGDKSCYVQKINEVKKIVLAIFPLKGTGAGMVRAQPYLNKTS